MQQFLPSKVFTKLTLFDIVAENLETVED